MNDIGSLQAALITVEVVLGVLTIIVGLGAVFSYNWLNRQARQTAQKTAQETMDKFLKESNIKEMVEDYVRTQANQIYKEMERSPGHDLNELREKETNND